VRSLLDEVLERGIGDPSRALPELDSFLSEDSLVRSLSIWFARQSFADVQQLAQQISSSIALIDELVNRQLNAVLHHPAFQKLEASWRSLFYLADQIDHEGDDAIHLRVLNVSWAELERDLELAIEFDSSQLFRKIYTEQLDTPGGEPFGVVIGDFEVHLRPNLDHPHDDVSMLQKISQVAAASFAPWITGVDPGLFGLDDMAALERNLNLENIFRGTEYLKWRALRDSEDSRFLGLILPRVLAREPYRDNGKRVDGFRFHEDVSGPDRSKYCWGNAAYAFAGVLIRSFAQSHWLADIRGVRRGIEGGGLITSLPVDYFGTDVEGIAPKCSTEIVITDRMERTLSEFGFIAVCDCRDTDFSAIYSAHSLQKPKVYSTADATRNARISAMLQFMLCVSRFAHYIKVLARDKLGSAMPAEDFQQYLHGFLVEYVCPDPDAGMDVKARQPLREADVQIRERRDKPGAYQCIIHLAPHYELDEFCASLRLSTELAPPRS
jgi:type VI secretion system protein ImpD